MYIDIGADSREEAQSFGVALGQQIVPICPFTPLANPKKILAKAWDNRYGVGLAMELNEVELHGKKLPNTVYAGATVQEEVGLRGARTAANLLSAGHFLRPGCQCGSRYDRRPPGLRPPGTRARCLRIYDPTMITHRGLIEYVQDTADTHRIKYQYFVSQGGTDAGQVHVSGIGIPSAVIGICSRYIHTAYFRDPQRRLRSRQGAAGQAG
jgi:glutamyl aminopeptidase